MRRPSPHESCDLLEIVTNSRDDAYVIGYLLASVQSKGDVHHLMGQFDNVVLLEEESDVR